MKFVIAMSLSHPNIIGKNVTIGNNTVIYNNVEIGDNLLLAHLQKPFALLYT